MLLITRKATMAGNLAAILICIFNVIYLGCAKRDTSYYVTAFTNDIQDSKSNTSKPLDYHFKYKSLSIHTRLIELPSTSGLSQLIETFPNVLSQNYTSTNGTKILHLSHIIEEKKKILKEVYWKRKQISSDVTKCSQIFEESINTYSSCGKYGMIHADAISMLTYKVFVQPIMIVVDQDPCSHQFASMLKNSTYTGAGSYQEPFFHFVNNSPNLLSDLSKMLYKATVQSVTTIILLCSDSLIDLTFRLAKASAISYSNIIWVAIEYSSTINNTLAPPLLLSTSFQLGSDFSVAELPRSARRILVAKAVASFGLKEQVITQLDAIELVKQSLAKFPPPSCAIQLGNSQIALLSLRKSQHTWVPFYMVHSDSTVSQLLEDEQVSWMSRLKNHKAKIIVTTMPEVPFVTTVKQYYSDYTKQCSQGIRCKVPKRFSNGTVWEVSCCVGSIMELLKKIQEDLWLAIDLHIAEDGFFGSIVNGTWNGMIGELVTGKADMAFATLTSTSKRSTVVDYGESFLHINLGILVASHYADDIKFFNFNFVANVTGDLLLALLGMFTFGLILLYVTENFLNRLKGLERHYAFREGFSYLTGITFQRDLGGGNPNRSATRIMFIVLAFCMVIIMTTYTATLTAVQVKQDSKNILTGMNDPKLANPTESFKFAAMKSSSVEEYFRFSDNTVFRRMNTFMEKYNTESNEIGTKKVIKGELQAFIAEYSVLQYHVSQQKDCQLRAIKTTNGQSTWNVAFQKNSPWKSIISKKILEYKEKGLLDDIITRWMQSKCITQNAGHPTSQKYRIAHFSGLIILVALVFVFSIIVLLIECWVSKKVGKSTDCSHESK